jgi:hypothetical protein
MSASFFALLESLVHRGDGGVANTNRQDGGTSTPNTNIEVGESLPDKLGRGSDWRDANEHAGVHYLRVPNWTKDDLAVSPPTTDREVLDLLEWSDSDSGDDLAERAEDLKRKTAVLLR